MSAMLAIAIKDLRTFTRQRASLFFTFVWPLCVAVLFGVLFGGSDRPTPRLPIVVVDEDKTDGSRAFADRLVARDTFDATVAAGRTDALEAVRKGERTAAVLLRPGFGEASSRMFYGAPPEVQVYTDPSRQAERGMLEGLLMQQGAERMQAMFSNPTSGRENAQATLQDLRKTQPGSEPGSRDLPRPARRVPRYTRRRGADARGRLGHHQRRLGASADHAGGSAAAAPGPRNGYDLTFPQAILWAIFGCVMAFGTTFASERVRGTLVRLHVSPLSRGQVLAGKSLAALLAICLVEVLLLLLGVTAFGVRASSWPLLLAAIVCTAAAFVGIILLLASMAHTEQGVGGMAPAVMMPLFLLGGAMVPLMFMPPWMAKVGYLSPVRWAIIALEGAIWRDFGAAEMVVPCTILLVVAVVTFTIGARRQAAE